MITRGEVFETSFDIYENVVSPGSRVLILNRCYLPIHITNIKRAVSLLYLDIAHGVDTDFQTYSWSQLLSASFPLEKLDQFHLVRTIDRPVPIPKVMLLNDFDRRPPQHVRFSRSQVFIRDQYTCQYCARKLPKQKLNIDHVVPRIQGGKTIWENVVTSCHPCNRKKGGRTPSQAQMPLRSQPKKPAVAPLLTALKTTQSAWTPFLNFQASDS